MRVETALLADHVDTTQDGKLIIVGVFDSIRVPLLPFVLPMGLGLRIKFESDEDTEHTITIRFIDPDRGGILPELNADVALTAADTGRGRHVQLALSMGGVKFTVEGPHRVDILVDGEYQDSVEVEVVRVVAEALGE